MLELLVVIAIMTVMVAAFAPGFDFLSTRPSLEAAVKQLEDVLTEGRRLADKQEISSRINVNNGVISLSQIDGPIAACDAVAVPAVTKRYLTQGVNIGGAAMPADLCFSSDGVIFPNNGQIRYEISRGNDERAYRLTLWRLSRSFQHEQRNNSNAAWVLRR